MGANTSITNSTQENIVSSITNTMLNNTTACTNLSNNLQELSCSDITTTNCQNVNISCQNTINTNADLVCSNTQLTSDQIVGLVSASLGSQTKNSVTGIAEAIATTDVTNTNNISDITNTVNTAINSISNCSNIANNTQINGIPSATDPSTGLGLGSLLNRPNAINITCATCPPFPWPDGYTCGQVNINNGNDLNQVLIQNCVQQAVNTAASAKLRPPSVTSLKSLISG